MAILLDVQSETSQDIRGFPVSAGTGGIMRVKAAACVDHTVIHYFFNNEPDQNGTIKQLWAYGNGTTDGAYGVVTVFNTTGPSFVVRLRLTANGLGSVGNALDVTISPSMSARRSRYMVAVTASVVATTSATYTMRVYRDGVLVSSGTSGTLTPTMTLPNVFSFTADGQVAARGGFQNARGIHTHWLLTGALNSTQLDALALLPFVGPHINHASAVVYSPATYTVEGNTAGAGVRPEIVISTTNTCTIDANAGSFPTSLLASRTIATLTGTVRWVDPFLETGIGAPPPATSLSGAPSGWTVGTSVLRNSPQLRVLANAWYTDTPTVRQRVALLANSRISIPTSSRVTPRTGSVSFNGRNWSGNYVDYDFCVEMLPIIRGRHNFQPPLNTTNGGAWGFDCELNAPLTTGSACVDLAQTTASRFGTGNRVGGPSDARVLGPGDPINVPASASYRLLARVESGLQASDAVQTDVYILNYPNSSSATVIKEAAQNTQDGTALSLGYSNETVPTLGSAMSPASFTSYNLATKTFTIDDTSNVLSALQVGDMIEALTAAGNSLAEPLLSVVTAISGLGTSSATVTVDKDFGFYRTVSAIATGNPTQVMTVNSSATNLVAVGDSAVLATSQTTPNIDGTWPVTVVSGTSVTINSGTNVTGAGGGNGCDVRFLSAFATPANWRLKWCAPGIYKISGTHAASQTNANWRGMKVTSGATGGGVILLGFGVSNVTRPGPEIMPIGWSGRGWLDQYSQMSHVVSARDGKTMSQRLFETLLPDLVMFSVADQGNPTVAQFPTYAATYVDYIRLGAPNSEIVMAGDCAHSALDTVVGLTDAATSYNNHQAAMRELANTRNYTYLTLIGNASNQKAGLGCVQALYARGVLLDGTAHPFRHVWAGWMSLVQQLGLIQYGQLFPGSAGASFRTRRFP
jgi:hypothetical protein